MCQRNGCYFDINTRQCFTLTQAPTPMPFPPIFGTSSPSKHPTSKAPTTQPTFTSSLEPSLNPSAKYTTPEPSVSPSAAPTSPDPSASPTTSEPSVSHPAAPTSHAPSASPFATPMTSEPSASPAVAPTTSEPTPNPSTTPTITKSYVPSAKPSTAPHAHPNFHPSLSPSASITQTVAPTFSPSYLPTQKPTVVVRSQNYCSTYHNKPRRCINRGCLFDRRTLQCTNGNPTSTPSAPPSEFPFSTPSPSVSPTIFPTQSAAPTKTPYRLRLNWEPGYKWQEDPTEQWYCWACAQCKPCTEESQDRTFDCVDVLCDVKNYCSEGMNVAVTDCDPNHWGDKSASFSLRPHHGLFDLEGGQIQVHNSNLCLTLSGVRSITLEDCDASKMEQRFSGFQSEGGPMELSPVNVTIQDGKKVERCITQHHHPRAGERIFSEDCKFARRSDTALWNLWTAY